ncbi:MAG: alanine racemase [Verrucomicrobiaceae bacterium]|nr:alanine racemase [Verrucomicrobiaceae bacterium]
MERIGVHCDSASKSCWRPLSLKNVAVLVFAPICDFGRGGAFRAEEQLARFHEVLDFYPQTQLTDAAAAYREFRGILNLPQSHLDLVRPGIMLHGVYPSRAIRSRCRQPVLSWRSQVVFSKVVLPGHPVSLRRHLQSDHPCGVTVRGGLRGWLLPCAIESRPGGHPW